MLVWLRSAPFRSELFLPINHKSRSEFPKCSLGFHDDIRFFCGQLSILIICSDIYGILPQKQHRTNENREQKRWILFKRTTFPYSFPGFILDIYSSFNDVKIHSVVSSPAFFQYVTN